MSQTTALKFSCVDEALAFIFNHDDGLDDEYTDEERTAINLALTGHEVEYDNALWDVMEWGEALTEALNNDTPPPPHPYPYPYQPAGGATAGGASADGASA